jgi:lipoyl(octanoyl) transferase
MKENPVVRKMGVADYESCLLQMQSFVSNRNTADPDELWILQHNPVFTMGAMATDGDILSWSHDIPVVKTDRGGRITFHGPGQIVVYLLLDIKRLGLNTRQLVHKVEFAIVDFLTLVGVKSYISMNNPGVYIDQYCTIKIASIGLKIDKNGYSYHGISLNFDIDKLAFSYINPCGQPGLKVVNLLDLQPSLCIEYVEEKLVNIIIEKLYCEEYK